MARGTTLTPVKRRGLFHLIPRHGAFPIAAAAGIIVGAVTFFVQPEFAVGVGANSWFAVYLALTFSELPRLTPEKLKFYADDQDPPVLVIVLATLVAVGAAASSLFLALNGGTPAPPTQVVLGVISVVLGWFVIHTMAALHYAFEYYETPEGEKPTSGRNKGGFEWPKGDAPNGVAFLYISYQVGAALQISDVAATSNKMRALIIGQTVFAFFYNTMLLAAVVNVVVFLASG